MPILNIEIIIKGQLRDNMQSNRLVKQPLSKDDWLEAHCDQVFL